MYTEQMSERMAVVATIDPAAIAAGTVNTDVIDMRLFRRALFVVATGALGSASATVDLTVYANTANSTSGGTAITGKSLAAGTFSGSVGGNNKQAVIEITAEECEAAVAGGRYVYAALEVGGATSTACVVVLAGDARYNPASDYDLSTVVEIVG